MWNIVEIVEGTNIVLFSFDAAQTTFMCTMYYKKIK